MTVCANMHKQKPIEVPLLNLHQLNVFLVAAETSNFTQAAHRLQMSQPSVSQHIQALEQYFGIDLFIRSGRSLVLTDAGRTLVTLSHELIQQTIHIEEIMRSLQGDVHGHLMVGCSTIVGRYVLPQLLADFHKDYPHVRATCHVSSQMQSLQSLCEGKVHLALTSYTEPYREIVFNKVCRDKTILIAPPDHPWAEGRCIQAQDLYDVELILPEDGTECHNVVRESLACMGISIYQLKSLLILGSPEAIALSVQEGLGVGFVSEIIVKKLLSDSVVPITIQGLDIYQEIYLGRNPNLPATSAQKAFWEYIFSKGITILDKLIET
jgi:DNA-binding transcriptional LysR family regulator